MSLAALRRFAVAAPDEPERCGMCGVPLPAAHGHVVGPDLRCACRACYLLFVRDGAGAGRVRAVPERYLACPITDEDWDALDIPVLPVFVVTGGHGVLARHPSPAGVIESTVDPSGWLRLLGRQPLLATLAAEVEAVVAFRSAGVLETFLVPVDACYRFAGEIRLAWSGWDGGDAVRAVVAGFVADLRTRAEP